MILLTAIYALQKKCAMNLAAKLLSLLIHSLHFSIVNTHHKV